MSGITSFVAAFCITCIIAGALNIISPQNAMEKPVKYILSLVLIVCIISSAAVIKKPDIPQFQSNDTSSKDEEMLISAAKLSIETALKNNNINFSEITVCTDKSESGSIIITKVIIYSDSDKQDILNLFESTYKNYEVEIINE